MEKELKIMHFLFGKLELMGMTLSRQGFLFLELSMLGFFLNNIC